MGLIAADAFASLGAEPEAQNIVRYVCHDCRQRWSRGESQSPSQELRRMRAGMRFLSLIFALFTLLGGAFPRIIHAQTATCNDGQVDLVLLLGAVWPDVQIQVLQDPHAPFTQVCWNFVISSTDTLRPTDSLVAHLGIAVSTPFDRHNPVVQANKPE